MSLFKNPRSLAKCGLHTISMWYNVQILVCFFFLSSAASEIAGENTSTEGLASSNETDNKDSSKYQFKSELEDRRTQNVQHRKEVRLPNGTVTGSYGLLEPDGSIRMVHYVTDANGFRALVKKADNSSDAADTVLDKDSIESRLEPMKHLTNDDLIHVSKSPLMLSAIDSLKQFAASSIHEIRERPSSNPYYGRNASDLYIFIPDKILIRREVEGKNGEFVTEEIDTDSEGAGDVKSLAKRSVESKPAAKLALAQVFLPPRSIFNKNSVMFLLNQNDPRFSSSKTVHKRELTGQNGQYLTVQQQGGDGGPAHTITYNNHENGPPADGFYEKVAPKIQDFTQNLAQQWANYATKQQPLQPIVNALPQSSGSGTPYVVGVPPDYSKQTYRYPLNDGPSGEYASPQNQQYSAAPPINGQYNVGPPINQPYNGVPINQESYGPPQQYNGPPINPNYGPAPANQPYALAPVNVEVNGVPAGLETAGYNQSPVSQYGGPPPDLGPPPPQEEQYDPQNSQAGLVLPPGYGQYNGPTITTNPSYTDSAQYSIPSTVPSAYSAPPNIPLQNPYPPAPINPSIPPGSYPTAAPDGPPLNYNNLNAPIQDHLNRLNSPAVSQLNIQQFNVPVGNGVDPYVKVVPQEVDPNQYNLFNRPIGKQTGPSSPKPLPTDPDYYTSFNGNPYDPLDTNALKKQRIYMEPDVNRHSSSFGNSQRPAPYDIVHTGNNRYLPSSSNSVSYSTPGPASGDSGQQPSSPAPSLSVPQLPSLSPPSSNPPDPKTRIIYYDENIKA